MEFRNTLNEYPHDSFESQRQLSNHQLHTSVAEYLANLMKVLKERPRPDPAADAGGDTAEMVFSILTNRKYCYLSRLGTERYRKNVLGLLNLDIRENRPLTFYYDVGGGYHASVDLGRYDLVYNPGLSELFVLYQIASFRHAVSRIYPPGVKFYLVIDNICALLVNDIPLEKTSGYCRELRRLIDHLGMSDTVELLVEHEAFSTGEYGNHFPSTTTSTIRQTPTAKEIENVSRFTGRTCSISDTATRMSRYREVTEVSEQLFDGVIKGVHMTQRATDRTLCFRSYPGGDSRIQTGQIAISMNSKNKLLPILLTSGNIHKYRTLRLTGILPEILDYVIFAEKTCRL